MAYAALAGMALQAYQEKSAGDYNGQRFHGGQLRTAATVVDNW